MALMAQDKKVAAGAIRFILLEALGWAVIAGDVAQDDLAAVLA
jgi:3-dehydroquinate synthetase